ncbi:MAG: hypothetical protein NTY02_17210 [Acidobacteria bacterium]|nr:hypothetical protein [Acidobacteriota bacterium]
MLGTFLYLTRCTIKNRVRRRLQRLREPRYLVGLVVGLAYMYLMVFRRSGRPRPGGGGLAVMSQFAAPAEFVGSVLLLAAAALAWLWPAAGAPLAFSRAEVQFFFQAPVTRRELVHYKLLRSQLGILFGSAIATIVMRPSTMSGGWTLLVGLWLLLMTVRLHLMGVALTRRSLVEYGRSALARHWAPLAVVLGGLGLLASTVIGDWSTLAALPDASGVFHELQRLGTTGAAAIVLWPFRALVRVPLSMSTAEFLAALPAALALLALNYAWVIRADAAFEEASAEHAEQRAQERRSPRPIARGAMAAPFRLAPAGPPETAILWKNLILVGRYLSLRTLLRLLPILVVFGIIAQSGAGRGISAFLATLCLPLAGMAVLLGPQMMRNDLRQDLSNLAMLKTWPVRGAALIRGEVLAPVAVVTAAAWLFILTAAVLFGALPLTDRTAGAIMANRVSYTLAALAVAPALILSQTVVQNALAVLFPAWVVSAGSRARGIDAMGQRLLMLAGNLLALALSVLPAAVVAGVVAFGVYTVTGAVPILVPAVILAAVVAAECWVATELLGRVLDRTDVTAIEPVE